MDANESSGVLILCLTTPVSQLSEPFLENKGDEH